MKQDMVPINKNWTDDEGNHQGGVSTGIGFTIAWQRGSTLESGRNGAFLLEVLTSCLDQLEYFEFAVDAGRDINAPGKFSCPENIEAINGVKQAINALESRKRKREEAGTLGTTKV